MEVTFSDLKQKEVINISNGKHLGKTCDITFLFPEGKILGFTVTGSKGFKLTKQEQFVPIKCIVKVGEDALLINLGEAPPPPPPQKPEKFCPPAPCPPPRRSFEEYE